MDPVMEVAFFLEKEKIQQRIQARRQAIEQRMNVENEAAAKAQATNSNTEPISLISDDESSFDSEATMDYPALPVAVVADTEPVRVAAAQPVRNENNNPIPRSRRDPVVPMSIQELWQRVDRVPRGGLDPPACTNSQCPYCTSAAHVPIMLQRYNLMERLAQLERLLYGV